MLTGLDPARLLRRFLRDLMVQLGRRRGGRFRGDMAMAEYKIAIIDGATALTKLGEDAVHRRDLEDLK